MADASSSELHRLRRTGSGPSTVASRAWQVSDVAALTRPRSALGLSTTGGGGKLAGGKFCKGGSGINLAATVDAGGVGTEMLLAGGDQDDDDCCPTCLDLYTSENPRIWTRCGHSFHMQCIYEWLERKETCPLCESQIDFDEP